MSFLDDLLTLDAPLEEGQQLVTFPRTWRNNLPWNAQPFCYKAHQTKAGLYLVLPHNKDSSLFTHYPQKELGKTKQLKVPDFSLDVFSLEQVSTKKGKELVFESLLSRSRFHNQTQTGVKISYSYGISSEGLPIHLQIDYNLTLHRDDYRKVSFEVYRHKGFEGVSAKGPKIEDNLDIPYRDFWPTNYDATLQNLVELISEEELGPMQFYPLLSLNYVEQHLLH